jgi:hypothetical protein
MAPVPSERGHGTELVKKLKLRLANLTPSSTVPRAKLAPGPEVISSGFISLNLTSHPNFLIPHPTLSSSALMAILTALTADFKEELGFKLSRLAVDGSHCSSCPGVS